MNAKTVKDQFASIKEAAQGRLDRISTREKIAGAAAMGVVVVAAATALGSSLRHDPAPTKAAKTAKKPAA